MKRIHRFGIISMLGGMFLLSGHATISGQETPPADEQQTIVYVVQRGDTLFRIAQNYGLSLEDLAQVNNIVDPSTIWAGQHLLIPIGGLPEFPSEQETHVVQPGETLSSIARQYNTTADVLALLNSITVTSTIYAGQTLLVRDAAQTSVTITHVVEPGQTLFVIATEYGTTITAIQKANEIDNPSLIYVGQHLIVPDARPPQAVPDLPDIITDVDIAPLFFVEGQSGRVRLTSDAPVTASGRFLDRDLVVITEAGNTAHLSFLAIPIYTAAGIYPIQYSVTPGNGQAINFNIYVRILAGGYETQDVELPNDMSDLLNQEIEDSEINILRRVTSVVNPERYFDSPLSLPSTAVMNEPFGTRRSYNEGPVDRYHTGVDFAAAPGSPVLAASPGRVVLADTLYIRGISVVIDHGWGVYTNYSHLSESYVELGGFVSTGDVIGAAGASGRVTGAHLHWELWLNGVVVDPIQWVGSDFP